MLSTTLCFDTCLTGNAMDELRHLSIFTSIVLRRGVISLNAHTHSPHRTNWAHARGTARRMVELSVLVHDTTGWYGVGYASREILENLSKLSP